MRILLTGATGQLGRELAGLLSAHDHDLVAPPHSACDLAHPESIRAAVRDARPDLIINPAAYTAVDRAELEPELARAINGIAPAVLAEEARLLGVPLFHFSTDYVFGGDASAPYIEDQRGSRIAHRGTDAFRMGQVSGRMRRRNQVVVVRAQQSGQLAAKLTGRAGKQYSHYS